MNDLPLSATRTATCDRIRHFFHRCRRHKSHPEPNPERRDMVMTSEVDFFGLARLLIGQYGAGARAHAARLLQDAVRENDPEAAADWIAVERAIALLTNDAAMTAH